MSRNSVALEAEGVQLLINFERYLQNARKRHTSDAVLACGYLITSFCPLPKQMADSLLLIGYFQKKFKKKKKEEHFTRFDINPLVNE